jgi:dTDP-4-amino-4,6-dideoxygalactose transaminase
LDAKIAAAPAAQVPMIDLRRQHESLRDELLAKVQEIFTAASFIGGAENEALEREVAAYLGVRYAIGQSSGTEAIHLALRAAGIGPGDEVITTPFTFIATANAICHAGAEPVFADIDPVTFNLSPEAVERAITPRTRAVMPVHLFGQAADMHALMPLAREHGLAVVEDCAQSLGASLGGTPTGAFGDAGTFSFYPTKNLGGCGDGGMTVTNSEEIAVRLRRLANHGVGGPQEYLEVGYNSRLDSLQAAALRIKLRRLDDWNAARRRIAARYDELLAGLPVQLPRTAPDRVHIYHHYTVLLERRDAVAAALRARGVGSALHYPRPLHWQPAYAARFPGLSLPIAEDASRRCLSLPMYPELRDDEIERVAAALAEVLQG